MHPLGVDPPPVLVGRSPRIRQVQQLIQKAGKTQAPVLILGETGTGKEVAARLIHSVRNRGPFVPIDCSALAGPLLESELFGHARGAFTGAVASKRGLVEAASGGTAFFDEIGELSLELQAKLLRLTQQKEYRPVGSLELKKADFRLIAATNRDLAREVERGRFRADLYFRLNVVTLRMPPLRERKEDIPELASHFLAKYGGGRHSLTRECLDAMLAYDWPGNVRELENAIERMVSLNSGPLLHSADLPTAIQNHLTARRAEQAAMTAVAGGASLPGGQHGASAEHPDLRPVLSMTELEREAILRALEFTKGDRVMAAHLLGIGRTTLYRKLKEYRISD
ncbi:MAG: sigma-54 interaction domain-containing protein [Bryobacteraceae bacterium]